MSNISKDAIEKLISGEPFGHDQVIELRKQARTELAAAIAEIERLRRLCGEAEHIISVRYGGVLDQYAHQHDDWEKDIIKQLQSSKPL